ncbi:LPXTG cell wall anchor domain-containing protein [Pallidibacillus pasinlerensis]|uniref:LPXTG cell wall anchor domain-containing protein n=1 Tax=Pallidibacillus pasinlerensis TaxID=2703818 RepID=A0ABX0A2H2_9BACI|nr:LPXTG cell wall anchor domain-containing protein [Pallidibacillus pasinlerensis]NCU16716.1 LPXTG cell wall anchor domain-containing protein [Pallidibacillus pasinlerensis]
MVGKLDDSTKKPDAKGEDSTGKSKGGKGGKLPSTATTVYNMLGAGLGFLVVSIFLGVYAYIRKRSQIIKE